MFFLNIYALCTFNMLGQYFDILYVVGQCIRGPLINKVKSSNFDKLFLTGF